MAPRKLETKTIHIDAPKPCLYIHELWFVRVGLGFWVGFVALHVLMVGLMFGAALFGWSLPDVVVQLREMFWQIVVSFSPIPLMAVAQGFWAASANEMWEKWRSAIAEGDRRLTRDLIVTATTASPTTSREFKASIAAAVKAGFISRTEARDLALGGATGEPMPPRKGPPKHRKHPPTEVVMSCPGCQAAIDAVLND